MRNRIASNLSSIVPELLVQGRQLVKSLDGNIWVTDPAPKLAKVTDDLDGLEAAEVKARIGGAGAVKARDLQKDVVECDLLGLHWCVQQAVFANPGKEDLVIASAGMTRKLVTSTTKDPLSARMGVGEVIIEAKSAGQRAGYEWQMSSDGGVTWVTFGFTQMADTSVPGLTVGKVYHFRVRTTVKRTTSDWSPAIAFMVH